MPDPDDKDLQHPNAALLRAKYGIAVPQAPDEDTTEEDEEDTDATSK